jgi:hypothetical protein
MLLVTVGAELDGLLTAQKEREAAAKGEKTDQKYTLYMTLYQYKRLVKHLSTIPSNR